MAGTPPVTGLFVSDDNVVAKEVGYYENIDAGFGDRAVRVLSETSGVGVFPPDRSIYAAAYYLNARRIFSKLAIGRNMRVFKSTWGDAFFRYVNALVMPGGRIFIPCDTGEAAYAGLYTLEDLQKLFGQEATRCPGTNVAVFNAVESIEAGPSTLTWFAERCGQIVHDELALRMIPDLVNMCRFDDMFLEMLLTGAEPLVQRPRDWLGGEVEVRNPRWFEVPASDPNVPKISYGEAFSNALKSVSYLFCGLKYKVPVIRNILDRHAGNVSGGAALDLGGGYGTFGAELLLDKKLGLSRAVVDDFSTIYTSQSLNLYRAFRPELHGRFKIASVPMEMFPFDRQYNLITAISSLLYCPKQDWKGLVQKCWEHLAPGGALIIFELPKGNPKNPHFKVQFTAEELEAELGQYSEIFRYGATSLRLLTDREAAPIPTFRAIVKK